MINVMKIAQYKPGFVHCLAGIGHVQSLEMMLHLLTSTLAQCGVTLPPEALTTKPTSLLSPTTALIHQSLPGMVSDLAVQT